MIIFKALNPKDDVDRIYEPRKGGRGLTSIEDNIDASIQWLEDDTEKRKGGLIAAKRNDTDNKG